MAQLLPTFFVAAAGVCLVLVLLALWYSLRQVLAGDADARQPQRISLNATQQALTHEKDELLAAIRELRFEHELGKVGDADLQRFEQRYRGRAKEVLRLLDEQLEPHREQARALIEQALRGTASVKPEAKAKPASTAEQPVDKTDAKPKPDAEPKARAAAEPAQATSATRPGCPGCDASNEPDAVFCKKCGTRMQPEPT